MSTSTAIRGINNLRRENLPEILVQLLLPDSGLSVEAGRNSYSSHGRKEVHRM